MFPFQRGFIQYLVSLPVTDVALSFFPSISVVPKKKKKKEFGSFSSGANGWVAELDGLSPYTSLILCTVLAINCVSLGLSGIFHIALS